MAGRDRLEEEEGYVGTLDLSRDSEDGNVCLWCWREVGRCACVHTRVHMLALIRLCAHVCSMLREHMSTVLCKPACSVCYANMRVFMHPCVQVCAGGTCMCAFTQALPVCMCAHTYTCMCEYLHVCVAGVYTCARW